VHKVGHAKIRQLTPDGVLSPTHLDAENAVRPFVAKKRFRDKTTKSELSPAA
jgi:hypothetical protein